MSQELSAVPGSNIGGSWADFMLATDFASRVQLNALFEVSNIYLVTKITKATYDMVQSTLHLVMLARTTWLSPNLPRNEKQRLSTSLLSELPSLLWSRIHQMYRICMISYQGILGPYFPDREGRSIYCRMRAEMSGIANLYQW